MLVFLTAFIFPAYGSQTMFCGDDGFVMDETDRVVGIVWGVRDDAPRVDIGMVDVELAELLDDRDSVVGYVWGPHGDASIGYVWGPHGREVIGYVWGPHGDTAGF